MKLSYLITTLFIFVAFATSAQQVTVLDSARREPVPGATVSVADIAGGKVTKQGATDANGVFIVTPGSGALYLSISAVGYKKANVQLDKKSLTVLLAPDQRQLKEVTIKGDKSPVTFNGNMMEYDISQVPNAAYLSLPDIIDQLPFLQVMDKSIKMMNEPLKILIDGRPNSIYKDAVALTTLPPQAIDRIEVVLIPTARNGGKTLNIILKHDYFLGWNGSASANGSRLGVSQTGAVSYWRKKFGFDVSARYNYGTGNGSANTDVNYLQQQSTLNDRDTSHSHSNSQSFSTSGYYNFDDRNSIDMDYSLSKSGSNSLTDGHIITLSPGVLNTDLSNINRHNTGWSNSVSLNYTHKYKKTGNAFYLLSNFRNSTSNSDQLIANTLNNGTSFNSTSTNNNGNNNEATAEVVQQHNSNKKFRYTVGSKIIVRDNNSTQNLDQNNVLSITPAQMRQIVSSTYMDADWAVYKFTVHSGVRFDYNTNNYTEPVTLQQSFNKLTPNVSLTYNINKINLLILTYQRSLYRPSFYYTNPVVNPVNAYQVSSGSANLQNQVNNNWGVQYYGNFSLARLGINFSYDRISNFISRLATLDNNDVINTTSSNINLNESYTMGFSLDFKFLKNFRFSHNSSYSYLMQHSDIYSTNMWSGYISDRVNYQMDKQNAFSTSMLAFSPNVELQGVDQSMAYLNWNVSYNHFFNLFKSYPTSISLSVANPNLYDGTRGYSTVNTPNFTKRTDNKTANAVVGLGIRVQFKGKQYFNRTFNKEKSIQNNDLSGGN